LPNASAKTVARATVKQMSSFSNLNAVGTLYGVGTSNNPKRASLVFNASTRTAIRLCGVQHGFREDGLFLLHCGWGQLQECCMRAIGTLMLSLLVCCLFAVSPVRAQIGIGISIDVAPPPLPVYDQPPIPAPGYIWTPGYWAWDDDTGYYWVPGTWVLPPEPALLWTPGYWGWNDGVYAFHEGYWGPEVGFYGGVSYGFGYTGAGYEGGYWRDGAFFYNRNVNNISNVQITNVYNKTVVVNNTTNVSYNGGTGGTTAQATPQQVAAANQQHVQPTAQQTQHMQMAAKDPALSLNNNHGHPAVAATAHAAQLSGAGVVAAHPGTPVAAIAPQGHNVGGAGGAATGNAPAGQGAKTGPGNAATIQGNHALPGVQSPGTTGAKGAPGANTATLPGNHALPGVQSPGTAGTGAAGTGAAGTKTGPGNTATLPGNHAPPGVQQHGGSATGSPPTTVGSTNPNADVKMHKATGAGTGAGSGGPPAGAGSTPHVNKLPSTAVHTPPPPPPPQPHISSPPAPHIQAVKPPPPPPPARVASPPPPRPAPPPPRPAPKPAPAAAKKCPPGQQHC
jgi:WXXGXW repeat (2 copies)